MIAVVWGLAMLVSLPPLFLNTLSHNKCHYPDDVVYQLFAIGGSFDLPLVVMSVLYGIILLTARRIAREDAKLQCVRQMHLKMARAVASFRGKSNSICKALLPHNGCAIFGARRRSVSPALAGDERAIAARNGSQSVSATPAAHRPVEDQLVTDHRSARLTLSGHCAHNAVASRQSERQRRLVRAIDARLDERGRTIAALVAQLAVPRLHSASQSGLGRCELLRQCGRRGQVRARDALPVRRQRIAPDCERAARPAFKRWALVGRDAQQLHSAAEPFDQHALADQLAARHHSAARRARRVTLEHRFDREHAVAAHFSRGARLGLHQLQLLEARLYAEQLCRSARRAHCRADRRAVHWTHSGRLRAGRAERHERRFRAA